MNCSRFRSQLRLLVENRSSTRTADDEMRGHVTSCDDPGCREAWLDACLLEEAIGEWVADVSEPELGDAVVAELTTTVEARPTRGASAMVVSEAPVRAVRSRKSIEPDHGASRWLVISVALLVLVSLIAVLTSPQPRRDGPGSPGPVADVPESVIAPDVPLAPTEDPLAEAELSSAYLSYAEEATQFLTDTVALTLAGEEDIEDPTAAVDWIHRIEDELSPWGKGLDEALDQFLESLPDSES